MGPPNVVPRIRQGLLGRRGRDDGQPGSASLPLDTSFRVLPLSGQRRKNSRISFARQLLARQPRPQLFSIVWSSE
jgi:hypothetical protein